MARLLVLVLLTAVPACAGQRALAPGSSRPPAQPIEIEPMRIDVVQGPGGSTQTEAYDARSLFEDGNEALVLRRYDAALAAYDHLLRDFPDSRLTTAALYNAAQALEGKEAWRGAADRYRRLIKDAPAAPDTREERKNAHFRLGAVLAEALEYPESIAVLREALALPDLAPEERVEALARLGFAQVQTKDYAAAEEILRSAVALYAETSGTTRFESPYFVSMAQFYLAEIPHLQFLAAPMRDPEEQLRRDVEQKSTLFKLAEDRFVKTVDYKSPYWATAAVYQVAIMYKEFWDQWMAVPIPAHFGPAETREYIKQVNEQPELRKLLEKSLFFHEKNVAMANTIQAPTVYSRKSETEAEAVRELIARQKRGEYLTPGSRLGQ
jgi:TolA-binding protein